MPFNALVTEGLSAGGITLSRVTTQTSDSRISVSATCPDPGPTTITFKVTVANIKAIYIESDKDVIFETNDSGTPDDTINLTANRPYLWQTGSYYTNLLTTNITTDVYVTNNTGSDATVNIECVYDGTP